MDRLSVTFQRVWEAFQRSESTLDGRHDTAHWRAHDVPYVVFPGNVGDDDLLVRVVEAILAA